MSRRLAIVCVVVAACGGDDVVPDAGADAGRDASVGHTPLLPSMAPCPPGWVEQTSDGATTCSPWATPPPTECGVDEGVFPGEEGCVRVGTACPAGDFPEGLPTDRRIVYVLAGAVPGGTGTMAAPFATITSSFGTVFDNTIVAVGKGTYDEVVLLGDNVTLWGACPAETVITSSMPDERGGVIEVRTNGSVLQNLRLVGAGRHGVLCRSGCSMTIEDVVVEGSTTMGVAVVFDSEATLRNVVIRDTATDSGGEFGRGLDVEGGAVVTASRLSVERNHEVGIASFGVGSSFTGEDIYVRDTLPQDLDGDFGRGVSAELGGRAVLTRTVLDRNHDTALLVNEPGSSVVATDLVIRDTQAALRLWGRGINVQREATAELHRVLIERSLDVAIYVGGNATLTGDDIVVRETAARPADLGGGVGIDAEVGSRATLSRVLVEQSLGVGILAIASSVDLVDASVQIVAPLACSETTCTGATFGFGLTATMNSTFTARSFRVAESSLCGVMVADASSMTLEMGVVRAGPIGACVQIPEYDVSTLTNGVAYVDNGTNLDTTTLPLPEPFGAR